MKAIACALLLVLSLGACSSIKLTNAQTAHLSASLACVSFDIVFPATSREKIAFTEQERQDKMSVAARWARDAESQDKKWRHEADGLAALYSVLRSRNSEAVAASVLQVRRVCDPLNRANGVSP